MKINEVNSISLSGSFGSNLIENKFWAFTKLSQIKNNFDTVYMLGSWYGNAGLLLSMDPRFEFDEIINVEKNKNMLKAGIIDPVTVTKTALENAVSVASVALSVDTLILTRF